MTLKGIKDSLVVEKKLMDDKTANKLVINTALTLGIFGIAVSMAVASILDVRVTLITLVLIVLLFLWILDACCEDIDFLNKWYKFSRFWYLLIILPIGTFVVLKFFNFM